MAHYRSSTVGLRAALALLALLALLVRWAMSVGPAPADGASPPRLPARARFPALDPLWEAWFTEAMSGARFRCRHLDAEEGQPE